MNLGGNRDRIWILVVSTLLSLLLWLQVTAQVDPVMQREIPVAVDFDNLPETLMPTRAPQTVTVIAEGPAKGLDQINAKDLVAVIDLASSRQGTYRYPVQLRAPARGPVTFSLRRQTESISVAKVMRSERAVEVEERGLRPADLEYGGSTVQPERVSIIGPDTEVPLVQKVRAFLDLSRIKPGVSYQLDVEVLGAGNKPMPNVRAEPAKVTVLPAVGAAPSNSNFLIVPKWKGEPAFGFEVLRYQLKPNQVLLSGEVSVLAGIVRVETEPIDITGLKSSSWLEARIKVPPGAKSSLKAIQVFVEISQSQQPEAGSP